MDIPIIFEDDVMLAITKPAGMVVNRAQSVQGRTVQDFMEERYPTLFDRSRSGASQITMRNGFPLKEADTFIGRSGVVHRLDKETSGMLLLAKTEQAFFFLQDEFKERSTKKTYLAVVHGKMTPLDGTIDAPIGRLPWNRERFGILPEGRPSITNYHTISTCVKDGEELSVVEVYPQTGRTHQIRVHFKYINHPIVGDFLYAGRKTSRDDRLWASRVLLHAWKITFLHPMTKVPLELVSPIPDDITIFL